MDVTRRWQTLTFAIVALPLVYVLSYAPYIRYQYGPSIEYETDGYVCVLYDFEDEYFSRNNHSLYAPVEWMTDNSTLGKPLKFWAGLWDARDKIERDRFTRNFRRAWGEQLGKIGNHTDAAQQEHGR
jgi:hypothetical protein